MKKQLIITISLLIIAMFMISACSSGQAIKNAEKDDNNSKEAKSKIISEFSEDVTFNDSINSTFNEPINIISNDSINNTINQTR